MCMSIGILKHEEEAKVEHTAMALISFRLLVPASEYHRFAAGRIKYGFPASKQRLFTAGTMPASARSGTGTAKIGEA